VPLTIILKNEHPLNGVIFLAKNMPHESLEPDQENRPSGDPGRSQPGKFCRALIDRGYFLRGNNCRVVFFYEKIFQYVIEMGTKINVLTSHTQ